LPRAAILHYDGRGMYRSIITQAIVIRRERYGEFHKSLTLLTSDLGLIAATAYGAYKMQSRLRLGSEPFTWSLIHLYHNPVKKSYKVTDMEVQSDYRGLQSDLSRFASASMWAEIIQRSFGAGETSGGLFGLFRDCLTLLERGNEHDAPYVTIQFLWRFLSLSGYQPDIETCERCGERLEEGRAAYYAASSNAILCPACGGAFGDPIPAGALRYLGVSQHLPLKQAVEVRMEPEGLRALRETLPLMMQSVLESELTSLRWVGEAR
jgi:DNA repair protein RecO (recombination protein O)